MSACEALGVGHRQLVPPHARRALHRRDLASWRSPGRRPLVERLGVASPPVYGQGGPPLRSTSSTPIPHWPASRPRLNEPTIGLQRDGGREETTRRRAAQTPGARAASLSIDERYQFGITDDPHVHQRGYAHLLTSRHESWAALPTRFTSICWPRHPLGTEFSSTKIRGDCRSRVAVGVKLLLLLLLKGVWEPDFPAGFR